MHMHAPKFTPSLLLHSRRGRHSLNFLYRNRISWGLQMAIRTRIESNKISVGNSNLNAMSFGEILAVSVWLIMLIAYVTYAAIITSRTIWRTAMEQHQIMMCMNFGEFERKQWDSGEERQRVSTRHLQRFCRKNFLDTFICMIEIRDLRDEIY